MTSGDSRITCILEEKASEKSWVAKIRNSGATIDDMKHSIPVISIIPTLIILHWKSNIVSSGSNIKEATENLIDENIPGLKIITLTPRMLSIYLKAMLLLGWLIDYLLDLKLDIFNNRNNKKLYREKILLELLVCQINLCM